MAKRANADRIVASASVEVVGPLAPWRLSLTVAATALTSGRPLVDATVSGIGIDGALGRSIGVAAITWFGLGIVNRVCARAEAARLVAERTAAHAADIADELERASRDLPDTPGADPLAAERP